MANVEELLALIQRQQARIDHLERVLSANNINVPSSSEVGEETLNQPSMDFPELDLNELAEPVRKPPSRVETRAAIEEMPRICASLLTLWGAHDLDQYLNRLIIDDRGTRQGFTPEVMEELLFLGRITRSKARLISVPPPLAHPKVR